MGQEALDGSERAPEGLSRQRVSRDSNLEAVDLSSAAPGRLHRADPVTSNNVGFEAGRCPMVVNPPPPRNTPVRRGFRHPAGPPSSHQDWLISSPGSASNAW